MNEIRDKIGLLLDNASMECTGGGDYSMCRPILENETELANQILSIPELAIVDREAQPPIRFIHPDASGVLSYDQAQKDMLKAGWVREVKDAERD